jgi:hypothetical protein
LASTPIDANLLGRSIAAIVAGFATARGAAAPDSQQIGLRADGTAFPIECSFEDGMPVATRAIFRNFDRDRHSH